jgi:hypothetical protein
MKSILIIAFKFPPMGGIGTRRMAKFSKYLTKKGFRVHILTTNYLYQDTVNWLVDIENNENIFIHRVKAGIPLFFLRQFNNRFLAKFQYLLYFPFRKKLYYLDVAQRWFKYLIPEGKRIIDKYNIKNIIVTNPPATVAYQATYLKIERPEINLIQDFRDSWNDDRDYEYPNFLPDFKQKEKSIYMEDFVVAHSDYIINVSSDLTQRHVNSYQNFENKFTTIYNGFDSEDYSDIKKSNKKELSIIYAGSLGVGRFEAIEFLAKAILELDDEIINKYFQLHIYSEIRSEEFSSRYKDLLNKNIFLNQKISNIEIMQKISQSCYGLSINAKFYPYAFGTKVFDYMGLDKKVILISPKGELYSLLEKKAQFVSDYEIENIKQMLLEIKKDFLKQQDKNVNFKEFDFNKLTQTMVSLLK